VHFAVPRDDLGNFSQLMLNAFMTSKLYIIKNSLHPDFRRTFMLLWGLQSSVAVSHKIPFGTPNAPDFSSSSKVDSSANAWERKLTTRLLSVGPENPLNFKFDFSRLWKTSIGGGQPSISHRQEGTGVGEKDVEGSDYEVLTVTAKDTEGLYQERSAREFSAWDYYYYYYSHHQH